MRLSLFLIFALVFLYACNNNITTIGQGIIDNSNYIEQQSTQLTKTGTVKIDSFITSSAYSSTTINTLLMGKYSDRYSGTTLAIPCFQIIPTSRLSVDRSFILDSVTFHFRFGGKMWGDTLTPQLQRYYLYQLAQLPTLNSDDDYYFYNTQPVKTGKLLSTTSFLPLTSNMDKAYFRVDQAFGEEMFRKMQYDDEIFRPSPTHYIPYFDFLQYFKGLAIVPDEGNNCLMNIQAQSDSLFLRFHYHQAETDYAIDIRLGQREYQYNYIHNDPPKEYETLTNQKAEVPFSKNQVALIQGLSGYMFKIILPTPPTMPPYTTVIKAEIEFEPLVFGTPVIAMPQTTLVYETNRLNEIKSSAYNTLPTMTSAGSAVQGVYYEDPILPSNNRYRFDITGYYQRLSELPPQIEEDNQILISVPNLSTSFDRIVVDGIPTLNVYYAVYNNN